MQNSKTISSSIINDSVVFTKTVDKLFANIGDELTYTSVVVNVGSIDLINLVFTDLLQVGEVTYLDGTFTVDGISVSGDPNAGINIDSLKVGQILNLAFKARVDKMPSLNPIPNKANLSYQYYNDGTLETTNKDSNVVNTSVSDNGSNVGLVSVTANVDKLQASILEELTYTSVITNIGSLPVNNVILTDLINDPEVVYINNSFSINGISTNANPTSGADLSNLSPLESIVVSFKFLIKGNPINEQILNSIKVNYDFTPPGSITQSDSKTSNLVNTSVITVLATTGPAFSIAKTVDKTVANVGTTLNYTLNIQNTGTVSLPNSIVVDQLQNGLTINPNSTMINGVTSTGNIQTGLSIGNLNVGDTATVTFSATVTQSTGQSAISNVATVGSIYNNQPVTAQSNVVNTQIGNVTAGATLNKTVDKSVAIVGNSLNYTTAITNSGSAALSSVAFIDTIPSGLTLVDGSVSVNNIPMTGANPNFGISLGNLAIGQTATVIFSVNVNSIPSINPIQNKAIVNYQYNNGTNIVNGTNASNTAVTQINSGTTGVATVNLSKLVDKTGAVVGDTLTYTINVSNVGTVSANAVTVMDMIPTGTEFINGSLSLNNVLNPSGVPSSVLVGNMLPNSGEVISFKVKVIALPNVNPLVNKATADYNYVANPLNPPVNSSAASNTVSTAIAPSNILTVLNKSVDIPFANVGTTVTYTLSTNNASTLTANNLVFIDTLPQGATFIPGSVYVNGSQIPDANPANGIQTGALSPGGNVSVSFKSVVNNTITPGAVLNNTAEVQYDFKASQNGDVQFRALTSNNTSVIINTAKICGPGFVKSADKTSVDVDGVITYTIKMTNSGNVNAENVVVRDNIQAGTSFVQNSITVDGVLKPNSTPEGGINIGTIAPNATVVIKFTVVANNVPVVNPIPNAATITYDYKQNPTSATRITENCTSNTTLVTVVKMPIETGINGFFKRVDLDNATIGDFLVYTLTAKNNSTVDATNCLVIDTVDSALQFVNGSVKIDGVTIPNVTPSTGIALGTIKSLQLKVVEFLVQVKSIPKTNPISNTGNLTYSYQSDSSQANKTVTIPSDSTLTRINYATISPIKSVNAAYASVGDKLTYTVTLNNTGNVIADNVIVLDTLVARVTFVEGSVLVGGVPKIEADPLAGINVGNINAGSSLTVSFDAIITSIPSTGVIRNTARARYNFTVIPTEPDGVTVENTSNTVATGVRIAIISSKYEDSLVKFVDKDYAIVGNTLNYTVVIKNAGNADAINVQFKDTIPNGLNFVANSITVDSIPILSANPQTGFSLGTITPLQTKVVRFQGTVIGFPKPNPIPNNVRIDYDYVVNPETSSIKSQASLSNTVITQINEARISYANGDLVKTVDKVNAGLNEVLTYRIMIRNSGTIEALNVIFKDTLPNDTTFMENSFTLNGIVIKDADINKGVNLGPIRIEEEVFVEFKVKVTGIPVNKLITNRGSVSYKYIINPLSDLQGSGQDSTNTVTTTVNDARLICSKKTSKDYAKISDEITYSIVLQNTGNTSANNVTILDTIPDGLELIQNSLSVNGRPNPGDITEGATIGSVEAGSVTTVTYKTKVIKIPSLNPVPNKANIDYVFTVDAATGSTISVSTITNTVLTTINTAIIKNSDGGFVKSVDKAYGEVPDVLTYTIKIKNTGNATATNVFLSDLIPDGGVFINGSLYVNGTQRSENIQTGLTLNDIKADEEVLVVFKVNVVKIPNPNPMENISAINYEYLVNPNTQETEVVKSLSNPATTSIHSPLVEVTKTPNMDYATIGDTITYTINVNAKGNTAANEVFVLDTLPQELKFVQGSVTINGQKTPLNDPSKGMYINNIPSGGSAVITYAGVVTTLPNKNPIINVADVTFKYTVNPNSPNGVEKTVQSNKALATINNADISNPSNGLIKSANKSFVDVGEEITYTIKLVNNGNVTATSVILRDTLPTAVIFETGTVTINGQNIINLDPVKGIPVGSISPNGIVTVTFKVLVNSLPTPNVLENFSVVEYNYTIDPSLPNGGYRENKSNKTLTVVNRANISNADGGLVKATSTKYADVNDQVTYTIKLKNTGNVLAENVIFTDTLANGTSYVQDSLRINGAPTSLGNVEQGILIGNIPSGITVTVQFNVKINKIPIPNPVINFGDVTYRYLVDPTIERYTSTTNQSNIVNTWVNYADISYKTGGFVKSVDKEYIDLGEVIVYTIRVFNTGNTDALNVVFTDTISKDVEFIKDSFSIDGIIKPGVNPGDNINLGTIEANNGVTISFKVLVESLPSSCNSNPIMNEANIGYDYIVNPDNPVKKHVNNNSNIVKTEVRTGKLISVKSVDNSFATVGDTLTYTIAIKNTGNIEVYDAYAIDTTPNGTVFIDDSLKIDEKYILGENLQRGVDLGKIAPGVEKILEFKVLVNTIPVPNPLENFSKTTYKYLVDPKNNIVNVGESISNKVKTKVNYAIINNLRGSFIKTANKSYADIGDVVSYTIQMTNIGNVSANNIVFTDTVPQGAKFVENTIKLNGETIQNATPEGGVDVGALTPNQSAKITFDILVVTIPSKNPMENTGSINYRFTKDPSIPNGQTVYEKTNIVKTTVNHGEITNGSKGTPGSAPTGGFTKQANKSYVRINEEVTYSFNITNSGNVPVNDVLLKDLLQSELKFVPGTVTINEIIIKDADPNKGINVGTIKSGSSVKVTLKAIVTSLPKNNKVQNIGHLDYSYIVDPNKPAVIKHATSNEEVVYVNSAIINNIDGGLVKQVNKEYAKLKDILTYRIVLKNTGNVDALDVIFKDPIPLGTVFVKDSVTVDGVLYKDTYPQVGVKLGIIKPNATVVVEFKIQVVSVMPSGVVENIGEVDFSYIVDPSKAPVDDQSFTNKVKTKINTVDFNGKNFFKTVSPQNATLCDTVTYSFSITNGGNVNASNVVFTDTLPEEVSFILNSVILNGATVPNADPRVGIGIASIKPNQTVTLSFNVKANSLPEKGNPVINIGKITYENIVDPTGPINEGVNYSNEGLLNIKKAEIEAVKCALNKTSACGEIIQYKVTLKNVGNTIATDVEIYDELPECLEFIEDSVSVGCINVNSNITSGVFVGDIEENEEVEVYFKARVLCRPEDGLIINQAKGNYRYNISEERPEVLDDFTTNEAPVIVESPQITVTKCANKEIAKYCDEIDYFLKVENTGTLDAFNLKLFDLIPEELKLIGSTIVVNGKRINGIDLKRGISLGNLKVKEYIEISYRVLVVKGCCRKLIENKAYVDFIYQVEQCSKPRIKRSNIAKYTLRGVSTSFQQLTIDGVMKLPCNMPKIEDIVNATGTIEITKQYVIDTLSGYSAENKRITGHKLVLNGKIHESLEFIALEPTQTTHYQGNIEKFSTFIILSEDYREGSNIEVMAEIEDIHYEQVGEREVFISVTMILDAVVTC